MADAPPSHPDPSYEAKSPIRNATTVAYQGAAAGALVSVLQNALSSHKAGAFGVLTRTGGTIGMFGMRSLHYLFSHVLSSSTKPQWVLRLHSPRQLSRINDKETMLLTELSEVVQQAFWREYEVWSFKSYRCFLTVSFTARSLPMALASCAVVGAAMGTFDYAGQLAGESKEVKEEKEKKFFKTVPLPLERISPPT